MENQSSEISLAALEIAKGEIGKEEVPRGSNWGADVQKYLNSVGINFPAAWCMSFLYWCFSKASVQLGIKCPLFKSGGVLAEWNASPPIHKIFTNPQIGDLIIFDYGKGLGHVALIETVDGENLHTIEGNTNIDGSREGYAVERKIRNIHNPKIKGYLRY